MATEAPAADRLLAGFREGGEEGEGVGREGVGTVCLYFSAEAADLARAGLAEPMLYLNGEADEEAGEGSELVINNCCFPSAVSSS